jgi:hypothetical protein
MEMNISSLEKEKNFTPFETVNKEINTIAFLNDSNNKIKRKVTKNRNEISKWI